MEHLTERINRQFQALREKHETDSDLKSLYQILYVCLKNAILSKDIGQGVLLPPTRVLAKELNVSRVTVNRGYELLCLEGYVDAKQGAGYFVKAGQGMESSRMTSRTFSPDHYPELSESGQAFLKNVSLINSTDDGSIAFRPGVPPLDIFPINQWKNLMNLYWRHIKSSALSYSPSSGIDPLRQNLSNYLNLSRGIKCDPRQIIIVSGSLQSLYLLGSVLLNPGDTVAMENPTFPNVYSIFSGLRSRVELVGVDGEGLKTSELEDKRFDSAKLIHCTPSCHYPNGSKMSTVRRKKLLDWAQRRKCYIIENDYEQEVTDFESHYPTLYSQDENERTIYISTFNRILHPSIRLGFMVLPPFLVDAVESYLKHSHRFVAPSIQTVFNQFLEKKYLHQHIQMLNEVAKNREMLFRQYFEEAFGNEIELKSTPSRSLHILAYLKQDVKDRELVERFSAHHILIHRLSKCYFTPEKAQGLIMGYSSVRPQVMRKNITKMAEVYEELVR